MRFHEFQMNFLTIANPTTKTSLSQHHELWKETEIPSFASLRWSVFAMGKLVKRLICSLATLKRATSR